MKWLLFLIFLPTLQAQDHKWIWTTVANAGAATFDIETTQHCLATHTCHEGNSLAPTTRPLSYSLNFSLVAVEAIYARHHQYHKLGWIIPTSSAAAHITAGIANAVRFGF